jgi:hypothetical protein
MHAQAYSPDIIAQIKSQERITDFTGSSSMISHLSFINLTTSTGESDITANIGFLVKTNTVFNIQVNTPFSGKRTEAINVDGLTGSSNLSIGFQHNFSKLTSVKMNSTTLVEKFELIGKEREPECCGEALLQPQQYSELTPEEKIRMERIFTYRKFVPFIGARAKAGKKEFDFFTDTTLLATDSKEVYEYEGKFILGSMITNHSSAAISVIGQEYYDPGDAGTYNLPTTNTGISKQEELYMAAPVLKQKLAIQAEYRIILGEGKYAFQPIIVTDLTNKILDARVQFYFLNLKEEDKFKGLNGGLFAGYRTGKEFETGIKKENFLIGVFFSPVFDISKY